MAERKSTGSRKRYRRDTRSKENFRKGQKEVAKTRPMDRETRTKTRLRKMTEKAKIKI